MSVELAAWHYDGRTAARRECRLSGDEAAFHLIGEGWQSGPWDWRALDPIDNGGPDRLFGYRDRAGWRLGIARADAEAIAHLLPKQAVYGGWIDRIGLPQATAAFALLSALVLFVAVQAPAWLAPLVPTSVEDRLGDAMVGDFGGRYCRSPAGDAALAAMVAKLDPQGTARTIEVANIDSVNAIAMPGRHIIIFRGLIEKAGSPDEVAGVLAHELGHVRRRHTLAALMRQMGLTVVLGGVSAGEQLNTLLSLSFSRDAEHEADEEALASLGRANISPAGTADFFRRAAGARHGKREADGEEDKGDSEEEGASLPQWLATHPSSESRERLYADAVERGHAYTPALDAAQWQALRNICAQDKDVGRGWNSAM